ncbi:ATP-binding protein [Psychrobacillus sp. FSL H8-0487]|uniref:ATP-binding protein n=1 Tax=Psychrobacillus sp. FSL H8-0487 TaxID=2921391 RepID=UPI0030F87496
MLTKYEYKENLGNIFELFSSGLIFINDKGILLDMNSYAEKILDINKDDYVGNHANDLCEMFSVSDEEKKFLVKKLKKEGYLENHMEYQPIVGEYKYVHVVISKQSDSDLYLLEISDESEKIYMKKRLDQSESLRTLGQLAAGIAHEIRNPMTSLKGFTQLLTQNATDDAKRYLTVINEEINKMEEILTQFLELSKPSKSKFTVINIEEIILEVVSFMGPQALLKSINLHVTSQTNGECQVIGDSQLLKQVFVNAIKNGMEAMPDGGNINININISYKIGKFVSISVCDEGQGIDDEHINKIFQPFFTTKSTGTGLGLSHVYKVIEEHGGNIEVSSVVEQGTTFEFVLPLNNSL